MMAVAAEVVAKEAVVAARAVEAARAPGRAVAEALGRKKSMQLNLPPWRPRSAWRVCAVQCLYPLFLSSRDTSRQKPKHHTQHLSLTQDANTGMVHVCLHVSGYMHLPVGSREQIT
jgi:hypothetical protein